MLEQGSTGLGVSGRRGPQPDRGLVLATVCPGQRHAVGTQLMYRDADYLKLRFRT